MSQSGNRPLAGQISVWIQERVREASAKGLVFGMSGGIDSSVVAALAKMACGDKKALARLALLDPDLTRTQPRPVAAATGIDAVAHAVETAGCVKRTETSLRLSVAAWRMLESAYPAAIADPEDDAARLDMLVGAFHAGAAIEASMLGAAHSCANPLTARFGIVHGVAVGLMLPHVVRFNTAGGENPYSAICGRGESLIERIEALLRAGGLPTRLRDLGVPADAARTLAAEAATQWTATFNPRKISAADFQAIYDAAM